MRNHSNRTPAADGKGWVHELMPLFSSSRPQLLWALVAMIFDALLTLCRPWPLKVIIDRVISPEPKPTRVPFLSGWLNSMSADPMQILYAACTATVLIGTGTGLLTYFYTRAMGDVGRGVVFTLRRDLFAHMQRLSLRFHDRQRTGDLTTRLTSDIQNIQDVIANGTSIFFSNAFLLAGMIALMVWLNWQFALAALSVAPLLFCAVFRYTHRIKIATRAARVSDGLLASLAQETLASIRIVQGLAQEEQQDDRFHAQNVSSSRFHVEGIRYQARIAPLVDMLAAAGLAIVMWYGATRVRAGLLTTGDVIVFFAYVTNLYSPMRALAKLAYVFNKAAIGAERIAEVMRVRSEVTDRSGAIPAPQVHGGIEFRDVSFEYDPGRPVLSGITLRIAPGEKIAIVGATGAGKSTLASLIPRLYDPSVGAVCIDGRDIRDYQVQSLREQISLVLQDSLLFSGTIRDNIAFGRPSATDAQIVEAAITANADEFIRRLPDGYETLVAERGNTLSGGQKQRIAIARAVIRDAPILILDEPTSGLDTASEHLVVEALQRAAAGRTTIMIAHRFTTIRFADRIIVIEGGQVAEQGTHARLLERQGRYAQLSALAS